MITTIISLIIALSSVGFSYYIFTLLTKLRKDYVLRIADFSSAVKRVSDITPTNLPEVLSALQNSTGKSLAGTALLFKQIVDNNNNWLKTCTNSTLFDTYYTDRITTLVNYLSNVGISITEIKIRSKSINIIIPFSNLFINTETGVISAKGYFEFMDLKFLVKNT